MRVSVVGGGFAGLSAACFLAKAGHGVTVYEKNDTVGGRARSFTGGGFMFDMGPSWYWMPDVFEGFFTQFGHQPSDFYNLVRLDPGFQVIFKDSVLKVPADLDLLYREFEEIEPGSAEKLKKFLAEAEYKYNVGMKKMVYKPSFSWMEFMSYEVVSSAARLHMFTSMSTHVRSYFTDPRLITLLEFPVLFLGATASQVPALYSMMNYSALVQGTWYPMGGMIEVINAMKSVAISLGVDIKTNSEVTKLEVINGKAKMLHVNDYTVQTDAVIASGDYNHIEQQLLDKEFRNYTEDYWDKRTLAPSALIFFLGVNKKLKKLLHHNLFFDASLEEHTREIYAVPQWPSEPLFYVCCPSKTDPSVAPAGMENLFVLMPLAPGLEDTQELREQYFDTIITRIEAYCGEKIQQDVIYKRSYCIKDFVADYHAYKGNAYGLANTLRQTAVLKPTLRNKKIKNLFYAGQLTVPGPGVPPSLISGQLAAEQLMKNLKKTVNETAI